MSKVVVGVADCRCSREVEDELITYALGSCIAVALHDPVKRVGGLLHFMLPDSSIDKAKADKNPHMFADTGLVSLIKQVQGLGGSPRQMSVRVAGGAQVLDKDGHFKIGKRNYLALRKVLWRFGMMIHGENVGGMVSRTVSLEVESGRFLWREGNGNTGELGVNKMRKGGPPCRTEC